MHSRYFAFDKERTALDILGFILQQPFYFQHIEQHLIKKNCDKFAVYGICEGTSLTFPLFRHYWTIFYKIVLYNDKFIIQRGKTNSEISYIMNWDHFKIFHPRFFIVSESLQNFWQIYVWNIPNNWFSRWGKLSLFKYNQPLR